MRASVSVLTLLAAPPVSAKEWVPQPPPTTSANNWNATQGIIYCISGLEQYAEAQVIHPSHRLWGRVEFLLSKWVWKTCLRNWLQNQWNEHHFFHCQVCSTKGQTHQCHLPRKNVCNIRSEKAEKNRTRPMISGNGTNYPGKVATPTTDMLLAENPVQQSDFNQGCTIPGRYQEYLSDDPTRTKRSMWNLSLLSFPNKYREQGHNYKQDCQCRKHSYSQFKLVPGLWRHTTIIIVFTLEVDDFGLTYVTNKDADHLMSVLT